MFNFKKFKYQTPISQPAGSGGGGAGNASGGSAGAYNTGARNGGAGGTGNPGAGGGQGAGNAGQAGTGTPSSSQQYGGGGGGSLSSTPTRNVGAQGYILVTYTVTGMNTSGPISLGGTGTYGDSVNLRLGNSATATITMNDAAVRTLTGTSTDTVIIMPTDFYGK